MRQLTLFFAVIRFVAGVILFATSLNRAFADDWTTYGYNAGHTGNSPLEATITADNVSQLSPLWSFTAPADINGVQPGILTQPLVALGVSNVNGQTRDLVFVGDLHGNLFAVDASNGSLQWTWSTQPGYVTRHCSTTPGDDDLPNGRFGMIGTPVIDRTADGGAGRIYVALLGKVYALKLNNGTTATGWPTAGVTIVVNPFSPNISSGGLGDGYPAGTTQTGVISYGGLTLNAGKLYVTFGGIACDIPDNYYGLVAAIDTSTAQLLQQWYPVSPSSTETSGSIWGVSGVGIDPSGGVFLATGNTQRGAEENDQYGEHVVKLSLDLATVLGSDDPSAATPPLIQGIDRDFGSNPILFQPQNCSNPLAAVLNKNGELLIYARDHMGDTNFPPQVVQVGYKAAATDYAGSLIGAPAWDASRQQLYVSNNSNGSGCANAADGGGCPAGVVAFSFTACQLNSTPAWVTAPPNWSVGTGMEGAITPPTTAHDVVYFGTGWSSGSAMPGAFALDARPACAPGVTTGCAPNPGSILWQSEPYSDAVYTAPTVVNGMVYVVSMDGKLHAYESPICGTGGVLQGTGDSSNTTANLASEGTADWIHWGDTSLNRKSGVTAQISTYAPVGGGTVLRYGNDPRPLSWTGGTPTATSTNNRNGVYVSGTGNGFSFTVPADTGTRTLTVHVGGWNSGGTLVAHLSDCSSTADFVDVTSTATGQYDRNYVLSYKAASPGQTLTVRWTMSSGTGNVTLNGAALAASGGTVTPPSVTTAAASSVASTGATLNGSANPNGGATTGWFRYSTTNPGTCNDSFGTRAPSAGGSDLGSGTAATAFSQALTGLTASTTYYFCAIGNNSAGTAFGSVLSFTTSTASGTGSLSGSGNSSATAANLAIEGAADWIHWGDTSLNRKAGVTALLSTYAQVGAGTVIRYGNDPRPLSWTGGTPTATSTNNRNGVYVSGTGNGFSFTAPADTSTRTLTVHVGGWNSGATLAAHLSDGSAADFVDVTSTATGQYDRNYVLSYKAASAGQTLTVRWTMNSGTGNVTLNGAALAGAVTPPSVSTVAASSVGSTGATLNGSANPNGGAATGWFRYSTTSPGTCNDSFGTRAPSAGGSDLGSGTAATAFSQALTGLSASTTYYFCAIGSNSAGTAFGSVLSFTTSTVSGSGSLSGSGNSSTTAANLATEGAADWIHWGDTSLNRKSGVTAQISTYTQVGGGLVIRYSNDPRPLSWTGGTPTATSTNNRNGVYVSGTGNGFSFTAPADTSTRTLTVHVGGWNSGGTLAAHLSDGSAADFVDVTSTASGQYDRNYVLSYKAASAGQTLTVRWTMNSGTGNVTLNGAAL